MYSDCLVHNDVHMFYKDLMEAVYLEMWNLKCTFALVLLHMVTVFLSFF